MYIYIIYMYIYMYMYIRTLCASSDPIGCVRAEDAPE